MKILNLTSLFSFQFEGEKFENAEFFTVSPLKDESVGGEFIRCEFGALSYVLTMVCAEILGGKFAKFDTGFLSGESNVGEEEVPLLCDFVRECNCVVISPENFTKSVSALLCELQKVCKFDVVGLRGERLKVGGECAEVLEVLESFDGAVVFTHNKCSEFRGGAFFAAAAKLKNGETVNFRGLQATFVLDSSLKGTVAFFGDKSLTWGFSLFA